MKTIIRILLLMAILPVKLSGMEASGLLMKSDSAKNPIVTEIRNTDMQKIYLAKYGNILLVKLENLDTFLTKEQISDESQVVLFINGMEMPDLKAQSINLGEECITFNLDRKSASLEKLKLNFPSIYKPLNVSVSIGKAGGKEIETKIRTSAFTLMYVGRNFKYKALIGVILFLLCFYILLSKTNMLRVGKEHSPFSLAQAQLAFWTLLIAISYLFIYAATLNMPDLSEKALWLMGISIATTGAAKVIDVNKDIEQFKDASSKGFLVDILSDNFGINIQRFQMVLWTLIMGVIFLRTVISDQKMIDFSDQLLMLMTISSAAYLGLKIPENKKPALAENQTEVATKPKNGKNTKEKKDE